jgi:hypothetical protein
LTGRGLRTSLLAARQSSPDEEPLHQLAVLELVFDLPFVMRARLLQQLLKTVLVVDGRALASRTVCGSYHANVVVVVTGGPVTALVPGPPVLLLASG